MSTQDDHAAGTDKTEPEQHVESVGNEITDSDDHQPTAAEPDHTQCAICLCPVASVLARLPDCRHEFCQFCLQSWAKKELSCPLCKKNFEMYFVMVDGEVTEVVECEEPKPEEKEQAEELQCLDHAYFMEDITRVMSRLTAVKNGVLVRNRGRGMEGVMVVLGDIESRLAVYYEEIVTLQQFEADRLLAELYHLQELLSSIERGEYRPTDWEQETESYRRGADDYDEHDDYYDDDDYGDYDNHGRDLSSNFRNVVKITPAKTKKSKKSTPAKAGGGSSSSSTPGKGSVSPASAATTPSGAGAPGKNAALPTAPAVTAAPGAPAVSFASIVEASS